MARLLLSGLTPGRTYNVQLRAVEGDSVSEWSRLFAVVADSDSTPPEVPAWAVANPFVVDGDTFVATWQPIDTGLADNQDFSHYELELSDGVTSRTLRVGNTSYTLTFDNNRIFFGSPKATVFARVRSVDEVGNASSWTTQLDATNPAPSAPGSIGVIGLYDSVSVTWEPVSDIDVISYKLQFSTTSDSAGFSDAYVGPNTNIVHDTVQFTTDHWYRVFAVDKFGSLSIAVTSGSVRPKSTFSTDGTPPAIPTNIVATLVNNPSGIGAVANLTWDQAIPAENDLAGFRVRYRKVGGTSYTQTDYSHEDRSGSIDLSASYTNYEFQMRSYDWNGNFSNWSGTVVGTSPANVAPAQITGLTAAPSNNSITYTWDQAPEPDVDNYEVTFSQSQTFASGNLTFYTGNSSSLNVGGLVGNTEYSARVRAVDSQGDPGPWSTTTSVMTGAIDIGDVGSGVVDSEVFTIDATGAVRSSDYVADTSGWSLEASGLEINNGSVKASAIIGDVIGSDTGEINVQAGASLVFNGGFLKSNTYIGSAFDEAASAGWYLADDGLRIAQGSVSADALRAGTISGVNTIELSGADAKITATGFELSGTGLSVTEGEIEAAALKIQSGPNIMPVRQASWEGNPASYGNGNGFKIFSGGTITEVHTSGGVFGVQKLGSIWGVQGVPVSIYLSDDYTDYNIPTVAGTTYIFSLYVYSAYAQTNVLTVKWSDGTFSTIDTKVTNTDDLPATATRLYGEATAPAGTTGAVMIWECTDINQNGGVSIDGAQVEEKLSGLSLPSTWSHPGFSRIDGGIIRTGAIRSNSLAKDVNGDDIADVLAWSVDVDGNAVLGDVLIRGRLVMGTATDYDDSTSEGVSADGSTYVYEDTTKLAGIGAMQSYNYQPGQSGWAVRSNGFAEFLQLKANSIAADAIIAVSPDRLNPGIVTSDLVIGTSIRAQESERLYVVSKSRTSNVATLTLADVHNRLVGDQIAVSLDQDELADTTFDTDGFSMVSITGVTATTISYENVGADVGVTVHSGYVDVQGRSVHMTPAGITLYNSDGVGVVVDLPTDPTRPAYFAGNVEANSMSVSDGFLLAGTGNAMVAGSTLALNASVVAPAATPSADDSYDNIQTWMDPDFSSFRAGLYYDGVDYKTTNNFFGSYVQAANPDGSFASSVEAVDDSGGDGQTPYGLTRVGGKYYVLVTDSSNGKWKVREYAASGTGFSTMDNWWIYDESTFFNVTQGEWEMNTLTGTSELKHPAIGTDGTNIYIARCRPNGKISVSKFSTTGTNLGNTTTNITDSQNLKSISVGTFDLGATRWVISTEGNSSKSATNYVTNTSGNHQSQETFSAPGGNKLFGTCWNGTQFVSLTKSNKLYWYSSVAKNGTNVWYVRSTWYDGNNVGDNNINSRNGDGTTTTITTTVANGYNVGDIIYISGTGTSLDSTYYTILTKPNSSTFTIAASYSGSGGTQGVVTNEWETAMSGTRQITVTRRANVTFNAGYIPLGTGDNVPDRARFYVSTDNVTFWRQANLVASAAQKFTSNPTFSGSSTTRVPFPSGSPAKIISNNGLMEISSDGFVRTHRLVLEATADANTTAGNEPPLMVGDSSAVHLRIDGNEIIAMATDSTIGTLFVNRDGETRTGALTTFDAVNMNHEEVYAPALISGSYSTNVNWNPNNGRFRINSSSARHKENIQDADITISDLLALKPRRFQRNDEHTRDAEENWIGYSPDNPWYYGFVAEEADALGLKEFVEYGPDGEPFGFNYTYWTVALQAVARKQATQIQNLKDAIQQLSARVS